ncbi:integrase, catalytic region, zinc finger, CCHC-type containing protein [Tanacetum coccineum]
MPIKCSKVKDIWLGNALILSDQGMQHGIRKNVELENSVAKLLLENEHLCNEINHVKPVFKEQYANMEAHIDYLKYTQEQADILRGIVEQAKVKQPLDNELDFAYIPSSSSLVMNGVDLIGNITNSFKSILRRRALGHKLCVFSLVNFCDADLELQFSKNIAFIRNLEGVDLLSGSRDTNLYIISLDDMLKTSPICLLSKASKTKSWLWHRRLSHLNFGTLNKLAKDGLARGIPRLKFQKDHLCSACALGKSKKPPTTQSE